MTDNDLLKKLESQIDRLQRLNREDDLDLSDELQRLQQKLLEAKKDKQSQRDAWDRVQLARHPNRPSSLDFVKEITNGFYSLRGDRLLGDDKAVIGGLAKFEEQTVVIIAQQKGDNAEQSKSCNFGMVRPEGYRKARRLMNLADRFDFPLVTFIDTPGAYPGKQAEKFNIGGTIARAISDMLQVKVPTVSVVVGEGGSGGAIALGAADRNLMLENAIYSVISPEGCAAILWNDKEKADRAASALKLTAQDLAELDLIEEVVEEGVDGAHQDFNPAAENLKQALSLHLTELSDLSVEERLNQRYSRYSSVGEYKKLAKPGNNEPSSP